MDAFLVCVPLFGVGPTEWVLIFLAIFIFFGATKLPQLGKGLGEGFRNFRKGLKGDLEDDKDSKSKDDSLTKKDNPEE